MAQTKLHRDKVNVQLNITLDCNLGCALCNRMCDRWPNRGEFMSVAQVERFVQEAASVRDGPRPVRKVRVVGGEPLLHPQFREIYEVLLDAAARDVIAFAKIQSNGVLPRPENLPAPPRKIDPLSGESHKGIMWFGKPIREKTHAPYHWSPVDKGWDTTDKCFIPAGCGVSLDKYGWLPCSPAIMIVRLNHWEHLYRDEIPQELWALEQICEHCIFSMGRHWFKRHARTPMKQRLTEDELTPTATWAKWIAGYDGMVRKEPWGTNSERRA